MGQDLLDIQYNHNKLSITGFKGRNATQFKNQNYSLEPICDNDFEDGKHLDENTYTHLMRILSYDISTGSDYESGFLAV